jgi:L-lactate dehydrogenase complex protein LldG
MGSDPTLAAMPWDKTQIEVGYGPAQDEDAVGVSHATTAIAETGTLVVTSGTDNPSTLNFLPETHIVVLDADKVVGDIEAVWPLIRARAGGASLPRTVNMISAPSRSADIEQTILLGAHGPRRLHVLIVG